MEIKILGPGCNRCRKAEEIIRRTVEESGVDATVLKVTDITEIAKYRVFFGTPVVVVDEEVKSVARVPSKREIRKWLGK